ncbi:hypothetical protein [Kitasatospora camelliae]|uniref:Uncharacterized protein n=1 Tax=Kitasatospora camelliae TaxID=3156397 RepID=A0AAU8K7Y5_9ACTN
MRRLVAVIALTTALTAAVSTAASAAPVPAPGGDHRLSLRGWALLNEHGPGPNPGERLTASVDARTVEGRGTGGRARGHATVQHVFEEGTVRVEIAVDCLTVDGAATTVTGTIESTTLTVPAGHTPPTPPPSSWHPEVAITLPTGDADGERRVGWSGADLLDPTAPPRATRCTPTDPNLWIIHGGFGLRRR